MEQSQFKGRKGQKRLRELNENIEQTLQRTETRYVNSEEMSFILRSLPDPYVRLYFARIYEKLDQMWESMKNYGFLRLCIKWIRRNDLSELDRGEVDAMIRSILPSKEMERIRELMAKTEEQEKSNGSHHKNR